MRKKAVRTSPLKRKSRVRVVLLAVGVLVFIYAIGLINPVTGMQFQYPYYQLFCGHKPIIAHSFMVKTYYTPDQKIYEKRLGIDGKLYCTESEAQAAGYQKNLSQ